MGTPPSTVLVAGHESAGGADLEQLSALLPQSVVAAPGGPLARAVQRALTGSQTVAVLPMTWGRDPTTVAETARTLRWTVEAHGVPGRLALCRPFGSPDHLVALLRGIAVRTAADHRRAGMVIAAARADPRDDAELHRCAHLVRTHGTGLEIGVACLASSPDLARAVDRTRRLGARHVVVAPAGFATACPGVDELEDVEFSGPLLSPAVALRIVQHRTCAAASALARGDDGLAAVLDTDPQGKDARPHGPGRNGGTARTAHLQHGPRPAARD